MNCILNYTNPSPKKMYKITYALPQGLTWCVSLKKKWSIIEIYSFWKFFFFNHAFLPKFKKCFNPKICEAATSWKTNKRMNQYLYVTWKKTRQPPFSCFTKTLVYSLISSRTGTNVDTIYRYKNLFVEIISFHAHDI